MSVGRACRPHAYNVIHIRGCKERLLQLVIQLKENINRRIGFGLVFPMRLPRGDRLRLRKVITN